MDIKNAGFSKDFIHEVVKRTIKNRIEELNQKTYEIQKNLYYFEKKYGIGTEEFYQTFFVGNQGDDMDFFEWRASWEVYKDLLEEKCVLIEAI